jgi:hypothetical protein
MQVELFWSKHCVRGTWFMLRKVVDVIAERTDCGHLIVRSAGGGTSATLLGKWVAPNRLAGEFWFGADGGGAFELLQCPQVSMPADAANWGSSSHSGSSTPSPWDALPIQEPTGYYARPPPEQGIEASVPASVTDASAKEVDTQLIFTSEKQLAEALTEVLKMHPNGLDLAQLKPTIHKSAGLWVSEAFLGYKKLRNLIKSPTMSKACWTQRIGSCNRVFGYETVAGQQAACGHGFSNHGNQQHSEQVWSSPAVGSLGGNPNEGGNFMSAVSL